MDVSTYRSDVVNYSSPPSAPLIIPIIFFSVLIIAIILAIIKIILRLWVRKRKSDTYVFVEPNEEDLKLHYTVEDKTDGKLIPLTYLNVRRHSSNGNIGTINENYDHRVEENGPHVRVEANVHQNNSHLFEDNPLNNSRNATESDV